MSNKRIVFEANEDTFPFDKLRVGRRNEKESSTSEFGTVHQKTFLETAPNIYEEYEIQFGNLQSASISYYLAKKKGIPTTPRNPSLYVHPVLYPKWSEKDPTTGEVRKTKTPSGIKLESFFTKFVAALVRELEKMSEADRMYIMGEERALVQNSAEFMQPIAQFGKYDDNHKTKAKQTNYDKSPSFSTTCWSQDETKRANNNNSNASKNNNKGGNDEKKKNDRAMRIPDTDAIVFTTFYITPPEELLDATGKKKSKRQLKLEKEEKKKPVTDYQKLKPFVYSADGHPNASGVNRTLVASQRVLSPSILWDPSKNTKGRVKFKTTEFKIMGWQESSYSKELTDDTMESDAAKSKADMEEFGFVQQQVVKKRKHESDESDDEEEEGEEKPAGMMKLDVDGNDNEAGSDDNTTDEPQKPLRKKVKTGHVVNAATTTNNDDEVEEVYEEKYAAAVAAYDGE